MKENGWESSMHIVPELRLGRDVALPSINHLSDFIGALYKANEDLDDIYVDITTKPLNRILITKLKLMAFTYIGSPLPASESVEITEKLKDSDTGSITVCFNRRGFFMFAEKPQYIHQDKDSGDYDELAQ